MDGAIQQVAQQAIESPSADNPLFWIGVGIVLAIQVADKVILWIRTLRGRGSGNGTVNDKLGREILAELRKLTDITNKGYVERLKQQEQVDDLFKWHSPDDSGEQKWKGTAILNMLNTYNGRISSWFNDCSEEFKELFRILRSHIKEDSDSQVKIVKHLETIDRKVSHHP